MGINYKEVRMRKLTRVVAVVFLLIFAVPSTALAAEDEGSQFANWTLMADEMGDILDNSYVLYQSGDVEGAKKEVDRAYYGYYEKLGFESTVQAFISGERAAEVEYNFSAIKRAMTEGDDALVLSTLEALDVHLHEDAATLDGTQSGGGGSAFFLASLGIIVREGFEAILVVGAIIAYLIKSGNKDKVRLVYIGSLIALAASVLMAFILNALSGANGESQEILEGATMLIAVIVLFYVSNWMISKAESAAWSSYIEGHVQTSISRGSVFSLAFAAFLAVFREGAETILFYAALLPNKTADQTNMIWLGLGIGCVLLVILFVAIRVFGIRIPLKPFFAGTSVLLFAMAVTFVGAGIKELQEGNLISVTSISGMGTVDILGIYPTLETLIPQLVVLAVTVVTVIIQVRRWKKTRMKLEESK